MVLQAAALSLRSTETDVVSFLLIASVVAIASTAFRDAYTVAPVVVILGLTNLHGDVRMSEPVILPGLLPPRMFDFSTSISQNSRRAGRRSVAFEVLVTLVTAAGIAQVLIFVPGMPASAAFLSAVILAWNDPVSVLAIFKRLVSPPAQDCSRPVRSSDGGVMARAARRSSHRAVSPRISAAIPIGARCPAAYNRVTVNAIEIVRPSRCLAGTSSNRSP